MSKQQQTQSILNTESQSAKRRLIDYLEEYIRDYSFFKPKHVQHMDELNELTSNARGNIQRFLQSNNLQYLTTIVEICTQIDLFIEDSLTSRDLSYRPQSNPHHQTLLFHINEYTKLIGNDETTELATNNPFENQIFT